MYISSYIHTHAHTHTYCVLVGACVQHRRAQNTLTDLFFSGITLSPLMFWEAKRMKPIKRTKHFELGTDSKKGKNELLGWRLLEIG